MNYRLLTVIAIAAFAVLRSAYILWGPFDVSPDEAHYWEWSRRLGLSYYSKGPGVAYVIALFTSIFGDNAFGIRIGAVLFSAGACYMLFIIGRELSGSEKVGFYSALLPNLTPLFSIGSILMTTDVILVFFWAASVLAVHKGATGGRAGWWYLGGALIGLGFLGKYIMVLVYPCLLLYFIASRAHRHWLRRREPWIAALISLAAATPVILWNIMNGQVTIKHTVGQVDVGEGGISFAEAGEFLLSQLGLLTPLIFMGLAYGSWKALSVGFRERREELLLSFFTSVPLFAFFLLKSLHGKVQANWAVASFVTAFPAMCWATARLCEAGSPGLRRLVKGLSAAALLMGAVVSLVAYFPWVLEPLGAKKVITRPPYNRVTAWSSLGEEVSRIKKEMEKDGEVFVLSDTYQTTSEVALYTEGNPFAYNVNTGERRMNQYDLWPGPESELGKDAVYVKGGGGAKLEPMVEAAFERCEPETVNALWRGRQVKDFTVFRCYNFRGLEAREIKDRF